MKYLFIGSVLFSKICLDAIKGKDLKEVMVMSPRKADNMDFRDLGGVKFDNIKDETDTIKIFVPDYIFVIGLSQIIPSSILSQYKVIGSHPTMLPKMRGHSPLIWTHVNKLKKSGATLFWMDHGIDTGDIWQQEEFDVPERFWDLYEKAANITAQLLKKGIDELETGIERRIKQDDSLSTWLPKRKKSEWIDLEERWIAFRYWKGVMKKWEK